eukprot:105627-Amphidinium_carterae.1
MGGRGNCGKEIWVDTVDGMTVFCVFLTFTRIARETQHPKLETTCNESCGSMTTSSDGIGRKGAARNSAPIL